MKIKSLKIKDFRQYYGEQNIKFLDDSDKNITIILGQNGEGKTGIFRAVIFCLFGQVILSGEEKSLTKKKNLDIIHLVNFNKLEEEKDNSVTGYVEIMFEHQNKNYIIKRSIIAMMQEDGEIISDDDTEVEMSIIDVNGNMSPEKLTNDQDVQNILSNILDKKLKDFFLFDGEKIEELSKPNKETREEVKSGVIKLLQIDSVIRAIDILSKIEMEQKKRIKENTSSTKLQAKRNNLDELEINRKNYVDDKNNTLNEIAQCKNLIKDFETKLSKNQDIRKLYDEINSLEKMKQDEGKYLDALSKRAQELLRTQGGNLLLEDYIISIKHYLEQDSILNEYSNKISLEFIEQLISERKCICGEVLQENSKRLETLEELRDKYKKSELSTFVEIFKTKISDYYLKKEDYNIQLEELLSNVDETDNKIERINLEIERLDERVKGFSQNEKNLKNIEENLQLYKNKLKKLEIKLNEFDNKINDTSNKMTKLTLEIEEEEKNESKLQNDLKRKEYIVRLKNEFKSILDDYSNEMRLKISKETTKIFKQIISDKDIDMVKNIEINEHYEIQVLGWNGNLITSDVSAGQRQIISLSFVIALAKIASGSKSIMNVPLFMDTPFGRISGENRDNLISNLPGLTEQWILLMTDTEFTKTEEKEFKSTGKVNNIYRLNKIKNGYTVIEKIDDIYNTSIARR